MSPAVGVTQNPSSVLAVLRRVVHVATDVRTMRLFVAAGVIGWLIAFPAFVISQTQILSRSGQAFGGDFVGFYTAGTMIIAGDGARLYDLEAQRQAQAAIVGAGYDDLQAYVNPPLLAALFAPLALLPYQAAYVLTCVLLLAALAGAIRILLHPCHCFRPYAGLLLGLTFLFFPISRTITGGQNTALTLLLLALLYQALRGGRPLLAGLALGALTYKPHWAAILGFLLLIRGQVLVLGVAAACAAAHYALGALLLGGDWPLRMLDGLAQFWVLENASNGHNSIALIGLCEHWLGARAAPLGLLASAALLAALAWDWRHVRFDQDEFGLHWAAAICAAIVISPHTLWYDAGLVVLSVALAVEFAMVRQVRVSSTARAALLAAFVLFPLHDSLAQRGLQLLPLLPLSVWLWTHRMRHARRLCDNIGFVAAAQPR